MTYKSTNKFYGRHNSGKFLLSVDELRIAFSKNQVVMQEIQGLLTSRYGKVISNDLPLSMFDHPALIIHIVPLSILDKPYLLEMKQINKKISPIVDNSGYKSQISNEGINIDGKYFWNGSKQDKAYGYCQIFHNGMVEMVNRYIIRNYGGEYGQIIPIQDIQKIIIDFFAEVFRILGSKLSWPIYCKIGIWGVKNYSLTRADRTFEKTIGKIDRDHLDMPGIIFQESPSKEEIGISLSAIFERIYNAAGIEVN
ncbi:MAG: hypothetical protein INQ03_00390 [Candidatus Heimdallarchaeota archaeon]|nr:hypothetical protein [Candidatus Heimdallarchaeota archaeon]